MSDIRKEGEDTSGRGVDWEVVSLTASTYAAAPGPEGVEIVDNSKDEDFIKNECCPQAMFMSRHFAFPLNDHENLPIQSNNSEILRKHRTQTVGANEVATDMPDKKCEESWNSDSMCAPGVEFEEDTMTLQGLNSVQEVKVMYSGYGLSSFSTEKSADREVALDENSGFVESDDDIDQELSHSLNQTNVPLHSLSNIPSESWWKRQSSSLISHAKEASALWSICVAASLMGLVILGQQRRRDK